jgi:hypothetical protein
MPFIHQIPTPPAVVAHFDTKWGFRRHVVKCMKMQNGELALRFRYSPQPTGVSVLTSPDVFVIVNEIEATHTWIIESTVPSGYNGPICIGVLLGPRP